MKIKVNIPLHFSREYLDDFDPDTIPKEVIILGEIYWHEYITIVDDECILDVIRKEFYRGVINWYT